MANKLFKNKGLVIVLVIVALLMFNQGGKKEASSYKSDESSCNDERDARMATNDCVTECVEINQALVNCVDNYGYDFSDRLGKWGVFHDTDETCEIYVTRLVDEGNKRMTGLANCEPKIGQYVNGDCTDSDGGDKPFVKGTVTWQQDGNTRTLTDTCFVGELIESFCSNNIGTDKNVDCSNLGNYVCNDGACVVGNDDYTTSETVTIVNNQIKVNFDITNNLAKTKTFIVEARAYYQSLKMGTPSPQTVCNAECPTNVHRQLTLSSGEKQNFDIYIPNPQGTMMYEETYFIEVASANHCCPNCEDEGPYGLNGKIIAEDIEITGGGRQAPSQLCPTDYCGDYICQDDEDSTSCPKDCDGFCKCPTWAKGLCSGGICIAGWREYTRTCNPTGCGDEEKCVAESVCNKQCTQDLDCGNWTNECNIGKCRTILNNCYSNPKTDGTVCTGGTCQKGKCEPIGDCTGKCLPNACSSYDECSEGTGTCESGNCCSGTCSSNVEPDCIEGEEKPASCEVCKSGKWKNKCEFYQKCDGKGKCGGVATWIWIIGGFIVVMMLFKMMGKKQ